MDVILLSVLGFLLSALLLFLFIRNLEACIFWSGLLAPAVGNGLVDAVVHVIDGNVPEALNSLKLLPFFIASIDKAFFVEGTTELYMYVGAGFLIVWFYVLSHYGIKKFGMWALPILPIIVWGIGLTLPNLRATLSTAYPNFSFLFSFYGVPFIAILSAGFFLICYLIWRRGFTIQHLGLPETLTRSGS